MTQEAYNKIAGGLKEAVGWTAEALENRFRALAINSVREARHAIGRDGDPWIDSDAQAAQLIYETLNNLARQKDIEQSLEAQPVASANQVQAPKLSAALQAVRGGGGGAGAYEKGNSWVGTGGGGGKSSGEIV